MRIVGGEWRGRKIEPPRGREISRPTTDRVREAMASMIASALDDGIEGVRALDAFAGTGALGIEMLSRGAAGCTFFDIDRGAAALVRRNLDQLGCAPSRYRVVSGDAAQAARRGRVPGGPFGLVLMDPPYALGNEPGLALLSALADAGLLAPGAVALFERSEQTPALEVSDFIPLREKRYGITAVDLLRYEPDSTC